MDKIVPENASKSNRCILMQLWKGYEEAPAHVGQGLLSPKVG